MRWGLVAGGVVLVVAVGVGLRIASNRGAATGVDVALTHLPPGFAATHGPIAFNPVTGTAHMGDLVVTHDGVPFLTAGTMDVTGIGSLTGGIPAEVGHVTLHDVSYPPLLRHIDRVEADDIGAATFRALFDPAAYPGGKPASADRKPLLGSLEAFGLVIHVDPNGGPRASPGESPGGSPGGSPGENSGENSGADQGPAHGKPVDITVTHARLTGLSARQFMAPPSPDALSQPAFVADELRGLALHVQAAEGIVVVVADGGTLHIDSASVDGYDGGKIDSEALSNISFTSEKLKGEARLAQVTLTGIDATRLIDHLPEISNDPSGAGSRISNLLRATGFTLRALKIDLGRGPLVTLDSIDATTNYTTDDSSDSTLSMRKLNVVTTGRDIPPQAAQSLQSFGMQDFVLDIDSAGSYDRGTGHMVAKREDLAFKGLGTLHITGDIDRLHMQSSMAQPDAMAILREARLNHAEFKWDDASLTGRLFKMAEQRTGQTEEALRASMALPLATLVAFFPEQPDIADQLNAFLDGRHTLDVKFTPPTPVTMGDYNAAPAQEKAKLMGVQIKGN